MSGNMAIKIKIEIPCGECRGSGEVLCRDESGVAGMATCSECDGSGYYQKKISLNELKKMLAELDKSPARASKASDER